jgi:hypothetical protein
LRSLTGLQERSTCLLLCNWELVSTLMTSQCAQVTDPYLNLFRGLVPPLLGTIDFVSPADDPMLSTMQFE